MKYTLEFNQYCSERLIGNLDQENTSVTFDNIPEPITADDMLEYVIRFMLACGYFRESIIDAMDARAMEEMPRGKEEDTK